jgi:hypothetical protein
MSKVNSNEDLSELPPKRNPQSPRNTSKKIPMSPPAKIPRDVLRQKLKDKLNQKRTTRKTKIEKKKMLDKELVKMGIDTKKFYESLTELNVSKKQLGGVISRT